MAKTISFQKQLCDICLESFSPINLIKIKSHNFCSSCWKLLELRNTNSPPPPNPQHQHLSISEVTDRLNRLESNMAKIIVTEGDIIANKIKSFNRWMTPSLLGIIFVRIISYLPGILFSNTQGELYPILNGIMTADLITWLMFNLFRIDFKSRGIVLESLSYTGMIGLLLNENKLFQITAGSTQMSLALLAFLATAFLKTAYWGLITFTKDNTETE
jgi:hypothetical protein